jgi:tetratricopeptide (TPR) repeat protein
MKTNTFIFNFINPSRLVCMAKPAEVSTGDSPIDGYLNSTPKVGSDKKGDTTIQAGEATKKTEVSAKTLVDVEIARLKWIDANKIFEKTEKEHKYHQGLLKDAIDRNKAGQMTSRALDEVRRQASEAEKAYKDALISKDEAVKSVKDARLAMLESRKNTETANELSPTKEMVAEIFNTKKADAIKLLKFFAQEGYTKGQSGRWNTEVLAILGKTNESNADKKKWIEAFQAWAGAAKVDGAVGPNTMLALATKVGESGLGRKIEGTMIARRGKKVDSMIFTEDEVFTQSEKNELKMEQLYAKGKELYEDGKYKEALGKFEEVYKLQPHPSTLKAIAECKSKLDDFKGARIAFQGVLKNPGEIDTAYIKSRIEEMQNLEPIQLANLKPSLDKELGRNYEETAVAQLKNLGMPVPGEEADESAVASAEPDAWEQEDYEGQSVMPEEKTAIASVDNKNQTKKKSS